MAALEGNTASKLIGLDWIPAIQTSKITDSNPGIILPSSSSSSSYTILSYFFFSFFVSYLIGRPNFKGCQWFQCEFIVYTELPYYYFTVPLSIYWIKIKSLIA